MPITGEVVVPAAVYKAAIRVPSRRILIRLRLFGGVIAVLGLLIYAIDGNYVLAAPFVGAGLALALISPWRAVNATLKQAGPASPARGVTRSARKSSA